MKIGIFETLPGFGGGTNYQKYIIDALKSQHEINLFKLKSLALLGTRPGKVLRATNVYHAHPEIDLWISSYLPTISMNITKPKGKVISLFFHLDDKGYPNPLISKLIRQLYYRQARYCDGVVTIAVYWRRFLEQNQIKVTDVIYWGFDTSKYEFSKEEVEAFKQKYSLQHKPVIYLGNCQPEKGVVEAYHQLKYLDAHFITSGEERVNIPARNLILSYQEYCLLLRASDVVLTLSKFEEGWNATAHEAMLAGTPVIGSGLGGMAELLEGGGQSICNDLASLPELVSYALQNSTELGERGRCFAAQFTLQRFAEAWQELVSRYEEPSLGKSGKRITIA